VFIGSTVFGFPTGEMNKKVRLFLVPKFIKVTHRRLAKEIGKSSK